VLLLVSSRSYRDGKKRGKKEKRDLQNFRFVVMKRALRRKREKGGGGRIPLILKKKGKRRKRRKMNGQRACRHRPATLGGSGGVRSRRRLPSSVA